MTHGNATWEKYKRLERETRIELARFSLEKCASIGNKEQRKIDSKPMSGRRLSLYGELLLGVNHFRIGAMLCFEGEGEVPFERGRRLLMRC
jgi:hypothetical protein